jgi:hypothetical protein
MEKKRKRDFMEKNTVHNFTGFAVRNGAVSENRIRRMTMWGCDGEHHATWEAIEYLNENNDTHYAEDLGVKVIGKCTGSCCGKMFKVGGFLGPYHKTPMEHTSVFVIHTTDKDTATMAMDLLDGYNVKYNVEDERIVVISTKEPDDEFRLAEMAMQMNLRQVGRVCPICEANGETVCGHLTFKGVI